MSTELPLLCYPIKGNRSIDVLNNHRLDEHYDMTQQDSTSIKLKHLLNQLIHNLIFEISIDYLRDIYFDSIHDSFVIDEDLKYYIIDGFYFISKDRKSHLRYITIRNYLVLIENIITDRTDCKHYKRLEDGSTEIISSRRRDYPIKPYFTLK